MAADQQQEIPLRSPPSANGLQDNNRTPQGSNHGDIPSKDDDQDAAATEQGGPKQDFASKQPKSPAFVAPIPSLGRISPIPRGIQIASPEDRPELPDIVGARLVGKPVDEDGDIVDDETGQVLAHAAGDLPSIVGRRVSNTRGDILGDDSELLGYVADVVERPGARPPPPPPPTRQQPRSLFDIMGRARTSLMVDDKGNILDADGNVVGTFHDNNNPLHAKGKTKKTQERVQSAGGKKPDTSEPFDLKDGGDGRETHDQDEEARKTSQAPPPPAAESQSRQRRTEEERRRNAEEWRKENPNESPSDIFLDVKSTREGIQLTIRIPTVFNGQQATPRISFS
ncbi:hypothetical protein VTJ49DRAFT_5292 [Mycothermus thermophilus]|uniref:Uncharacterized protein n=1 Tax=Humicola insolens TaxID=85995 RepID=A0ABR3V3I2_HUMIN